MKGIITFFGVILGLSAWAQRPISIQTVDSATYVVEYIPIADAQKNVNAQMVQVEKQLSNVDKQIAELVAKRDQLLQQQAALTVISKQLDQANATPPPPVQEAPPTTPPGTEKPQKKKGKN